MVQGEGGYIVPPKNIGEALLDSVLDQFAEALG